jgi:hypothetical protein
LHRFQYGPALVAQPRDYHDAKIADSQLLSVGFRYSIWLFGFHPMPHFMPLVAGVVCSIALMPRSASRVLTYDAQSDTAEWEGQTVRRGDAIPE